MEAVQQLEKTLHGNNLTTKRKRAFEDYSQEYDVERCLTNSIYTRKKTQISKITTEAHGKYIIVNISVSKQLLTNAINVFIIRAYTQPNDESGKRVVHQREEFETKH